jgi:hypothetical protein
MADRTLMDIILGALTGQPPAAPVGPNWQRQHPHEHPAPVPVGPNWRRQQQTRSVKELPGYLMGLITGDGDEVTAAPVAPTAVPKGSGFGGKQTPYERDMEALEPVKLPTLPPSPMRAAAAKTAAPTAAASGPANRSQMVVRSPAMFSRPEGELPTLPSSYTERVDAGIDPGDEQAEEVGSGFVAGGGIPPEVVNAFKQISSAKKTVGPTGPYAGNDQSSMIGSVDLSGLPGQIDAPSAEVPALESSQIGMDRFSALPGGNAGRQFSVPKDNLFKALLSKLV